MECKERENINILFGTGASSFKDFEGLHTVVRSALKNGIRGFDTAPSYGTEEILGNCLMQSIDEFGIEREGLFVQTKVDAFQMMENKAEIREYIRTVIRKMNIEYLDSLLIHWPVPEYMDKTWDCLAELQKEGIVRYIGICNVRMRQLENFSNYEVMPQVIQIERNPLRTCEKEVAFCHENDFTIQAYSPLCKMHPDIASSSLLSSLAEKYNKNIGQIILRWHMDNGVIPIFTSKKTSRIKEYTELSDFSLSADEIRAINGLNKDYKMYLEACACPGF